MNGLVTAQANFALHAALGTRIFSREFLTGNAIESNFPEPPAAAAESVSSRELAVAGEASTAMAVYDGKRPFGSGVLTGWHRFRSRIAVRPLRRELQVLLAVGHAMRAGNSLRFDTLIAGYETRMETDETLLTTWESTRRYSGRTVRLLIDTGLALLAMDNPRALDPFFIATQIVRSRDFEGIHTGHAPHYYADASLSYAVSRSPTERPRFVYEAVAALETAGAIYQRIYDRAHAESCRPFPRGGTSLTMLSADVAGMAGKRDMRAVKPFLTTVKEKRPIFERIAAKWPLGEV